MPYYVPVLRFAIERRIGPFLNAFSAIGWTLLSIMWFGITPLTVIFAISVVLVPFALVNMSAGLANLDRETLEMASSFTRRQWRIFALVIVPSLFPFIFATLRIMFGVAWKVTLTAELFGGNSGLGYMINMARQEFDTATIFAAIILIIAFVHGMDQYVLARCKRACRVTMRAEQTAITIGGRRAGDRRGHRPARAPWPGGCWRAACRNSSCRGRSRSPAGWSSCS